MQNHKTASSIILALLLTADNSISRKIAKFFVTVALSLPSSADISTERQIAIFWTSDASIPIW
jgi:hypothetical protein